MTTPIDERTQVLCRERWVRAMAAAGRRALDYLAVAEPELRLSRCDPEEFYIQARWAAADGRRGRLHIAHAVDQVLAELRGLDFATAEAVLVRAANDWFDSDDVRVLPGPLALGGPGFAMERYGADFTCHIEPDGTYTLRLDDLPLESAFAVLAVAAGRTLPTSAPGLIGETAHRRALPG